MLDTGDEVTGELGKFVREQEVEAASVTAIGAFSRAVLGYFQWETKQYKKIPVGEQVEVLSLLGDVAVGDPGPTLHLQAVLGKADGSVAAPAVPNAGARCHRRSANAGSPRERRPAGEGEASPPFQRATYVAKGRRRIGEDMTPMREVARSKGGRFELKHLRVPEQ